MRLPAPIAACFAALSLSIAALSCAQSTAPDAAKNTAQGATAPAAGERPVAVLQSGQHLHLPEAVAPLAPGTTLRVGTCDLPPWSIKPTTKDGPWTGLAVHLLRDMARKLEIQVDMRAYEYADLLQALQDGKIDVAATGIPITADNLTRFSMTPAFDESGLSIATHTRPPLTFFGTLEHVATPQVIQWAVILGVACVVFGFLLWLLERGRNPPFEGGAAKGLAEASWWSVVTMFTVGYGDRVPVTLRGKLVAVVWMGLAFVLVTVASGLVTSALTVQQLRPVVTGARDLSSARVGCLKDSDGDLYCQDDQLRVTTYESYEGAIAALERGHIDAVVGSTMALNYLVARSHTRSLMVLGQRLRDDYVGFGMRYGLSNNLEKHLELEMLKSAQTDDFIRYREALLGQTAGGLP